MDLLRRQRRSDIFYDKREVYFDIWCGDCSGANPFQKYSETANFEIAARSSS
jgi:hypothetical protein